MQISRQDIRRDIELSATNAEYKALLRRVAIYLSLSKGKEDPSYELILIDAILEHIRMGDQRCNQLTNNKPS